jgi:hypothetical protein
MEVKLAKKSGILSNCRPTHAPFQRIVCLHSFCTSTHVIILRSYCNYIISPVIKKNEWTPNICIFRLRIIFPAFHQIFIASKNSRPEFYIHSQFPKQRFPGGNLRFKDKHDFSGGKCPESVLISFSCWRLAVHLFRHHNHRNHGKEYIMPPSREIGVLSGM